MKRVILTLFVACCLFTACNSTKKTTSAPESSKLAGEWELKSISGPQIDFNDLYPNKKPTITFDISTNRVFGNTSCNNFNGKMNVDGNKISFTEPMAMTRMACMDGNGETVFMEALSQINNFSVSSDYKTLRLNSADNEKLVFVKK